MDGREGIKELKIGDVERTRWNTKTRMSVSALKIKWQSGYDDGDDDGKLQVDTT